MESMRPPFTTRNKSFVMRSGHITQGQRAALERFMPQYGVDYQAETIDLKDIFRNDRPVIFEIGFGMGETTAQFAAEHQDQNLLGAEVYAAGVGSLLAKIEKMGLQNIRIIRHDAYEVLEKMIAPKTLAGVHIFFPDPWPKKRHHKRRLITPDFIELVCSRLAADAHLHLATDWPEYAEQMLAVLSAEKSLKNTAGAGYAPRPASRPLTKFEQRGIALGHPVHDLLFIKRD